MKKTFTFYVSGEKWLEIEEDNVNDAMEKVNRFLPPGFHGWMDVAPNVFSATFGAWD